MVSAFSQYALDTRPMDAMSRAQMGLILGLEAFLHDAALVLTCPRCAAEGVGTLTTNNSVEDTVWKIDCQCRRRRVNSRGMSPMPTSGWLLLMTKDLLGPLGLDVRCPTCITTPLTLHQSGDHLTVTCACGGARHFKRHASDRPH